MNFLLGTILFAAFGGFVHIVSSSPTGDNYDKPTALYKSDTTEISNQPDLNFVNLTRRAPYDYEINCNDYPNVCENQCYYVYCKGGSWGIHVERTPSSRRDSECAGYNRCSHGRASGKPPGGWDVNPNADWSCDEQPKSSTREGGAGSATRCMPQGENSGEGGTWQNFINGNSAATQHKRLVDGTAVDVVLKNAKKTGYCASHSGGTTHCGSAASPPGKHDGPRQR